VQGYDYSGGGGGGEVGGKKRIGLYRALLAEFKAQDNAAVLLQAMFSRLLQGTEGRAELLKLRREARLMALGADLQCLDLISMAQDGDAIEVPRGRHYPRITQLAAGVSLTQDFIHVKNSSQVRVGSVVIVGREHMHVVSKKGDIVQVLRQCPGEILSLVLWHLSQKYYADRMSQGQFREALDQLYDYLVAHTGGFERDSWTLLCHSVPVRQRPTQNVEKALWQWLVELKPPHIPTYLDVLHRHQDRSEAAAKRPLAFAIGDEGIAEVEAAAALAAAAEAPAESAHEDAQTRGQQKQRRSRHRAKRGEDVERPVDLDEALKMVHVWWTSAQKTGRFRGKLKDEEVLEVPENTLEPWCKGKIEDTLRLLCESAVLLTVGVIQGFLSDLLQSDSPCPRVLGRKLLSKTMWLHALAPVLQGDLSGISECRSHVDGAMVRGESTVRVSSTILVEAEEGAETMCSFLFQRDAEMSKNHGIARLYSRSKGGAGASHMFLLYESASGTEGGCRPLKLVDRDSQAVRWMDQKRPAKLQGKGASAQPPGPGHAWEFPCTSCKGTYQMLHDLLSGTKEVPGKVANLCVRSRLGDAMRFEFGRWQLDSCILEAEGASTNSALVCGLSAFVSAEKCVFGGSQPTTSAAIDDVSQRWMSLYCRLRCFANEKDMKKYMSLFGSKKPSSFTASAQRRGVGVRATAETDGKSKSISFAQNVELDGRGTKADMDDADKQEVAVKKVRDGTVDDTDGLGSCRHAVVVTDGTEDVRSSVMLKECVLQVRPIFLCGSFLVSCRFSPLSCVFALVLSVFSPILGQFVCFCYPFVASSTLGEGVAFKEV
jgi:hypothetical protein